MIEIAKFYGVELITEPRPKEESGKSLENYIAHEKLKEEREALCIETEKAKQAIQAELDTLCAEKEELAKHEQAIENAYDDLEKAVGGTKAEIRQNEEIIRDLRQEIDDQKDYIAFKRAKADEKAEQETQKAREEREELARERHEEWETNDEIIDMGVYYAEEEDEEQETQNVRENAQNAPKTSESVKMIPDTSKTQAPLKNDRRSSEAYANLKKACNALNEDGKHTEETQWLLDRLGL